MLSLITALSEQTWELINPLALCEGPSLPELVSGGLENLVRQSRELKALAYPNDPEVQADLTADFADDLEGRDLEIEVLARLAKLPSGSEFERLGGMRGAQKIEG
jgi:hypothetical protein